MTDDERWGLIRQITEDADLRSRLFLVLKNVPFDVAFSMESHEVIAWAIIYGEIDGQTFDWNARAWAKKDS